MLQTEDPPPGAARTPRRARIRRVIGSLTCLALVVLVGMAPIPALTVEPGPAFSLAELLSVGGRPASAAIDGDFLFTTIEVHHAATVDLVRSWADPEMLVISRSRLIPAGVDPDAFLVEQQQRFAAATDDALAAAVNVVTTRGLGPGAGSSPPAEDTAVVDDAGVGGPSAGLVTALAIVDVLSTVDLAAGRRIAGTGSVDAAGTVAAVGSVDLKAQAALEAGATTFLVPLGQGEEARAALGAGAGMVVIEVGTLGQAVDVLRER